MVIRSLVGILFFLAIGLYLSSCSCGCEKSADIVEIPDKVIKRVDSYVKSKTGSDYFEKYISMDYENVKFLNPNYFIQYNFRMPDKPFVDETINFVVDNEGKVLEKYDIAGIPNCYDAPGECDFALGKEDVISIAKSEGVSEGVKEWKVDFQWSSELSRYVWQVLSTTKEFGEGENYKGSGEEMIIDPSGGEVLNFNKWNIR